MRARRAAIIRGMNRPRFALRKVLSLLLLAAPLLAQPLPGDEGLDAATAITAAEIGEHVEVLASDLFEGREAGTRGERRAAAYLVGQLETCAALQPDGPDGAWLQPFELELHDGPATAHNVLARLPGSDPALRHEAIVIGAHYDHVGFGHNGNVLDFGVHDIHNGADDNGSGSAALLDLATSLAGSGWRPRRTLLFQWYSGEELGLLGSRHWVANPTHPVEDVAFMVNMDMVGRLTGRTLIVGGTGTSPGLADLARNACDDLGLVMIDDPPGGAPSDNSSFYDAGVPALFLFTGLHPDYHRATDDSHKLDLPGARDVARLAERLVRAIDARDARPEFRSSPGMANVFTPRRWLGAAFEDAPPGAPAAVRVAFAIPSAPAAQAGLRDGDLLAEAAGAPVTDVDAAEALLDLPPGPAGSLALVVWREAAGEPREEGITTVAARSWERVELVVPLVVR
jgi:hypothetical protein